ncbi:sugar phosphate nucleotidyltransferase [Microvirga terrestris]|uniref:NTP transferase domain-containing protein n=1 Tax=Microvirga terrestris TaxID=2791024 RepID=A0ABS0HPF2_9HYPH|nr:sugar phosphate nucleotidyltransferase [Microvirga terrestris]MBF9195359.1 NTP transferase domain-containing protein [Microvirga terrestris]
MQAIIMAGGKGSRLHPYSALFPKPLMPLGDKPILEILLRQLRAANVTNIIIAVNHLRHLIEAFFGDGSRFGLSITYSVEDKPLGTAGPMGLVLDKLEDNFILTNGDLLTSLDIGRMVSDHLESGAAATIGTYRRELRSEFGLLEVDDSMRMVGYREKPTYQHLVSMGLYVLNRQAVQRWLVPGEYLDMPVLMQSMTQADMLVRCHQQDCTWLDIGRPEDFALAQQIVERDPEAFSPRKTV